MINRVVLVGRLTRDPELRTSSSGTANTRFTVACDRRFKQPNGPEADFISCVAFGRTAEVIAQYFSKGRLIGVEGRIQTGSYENQQGQRVYTTDVVVENFSFLESKNSAGNNYNNASNNYSQNSFGGQGGYGNQNGYQQNSNPYGTPSQNYGQNYGGQSAYSAPTNPYAQSNQGAGNMSAGLDDDNDGYDIASDDLPF
jgi:single-strand DNA-binding protein